MQLSLDREKAVTQQINQLYELAIKESDHTTRTFLAWFLTEQLEEVSSMDNLLKMVQRAGEANMLYVEAYLAGTTDKGGARKRSRKLKPENEDQLCRPERAVATIVAAALSHEPRFRNAAFRLQNHRHFNALQPEGCVPIANPVHGHNARQKGCPARWESADLAVPLPSASSIGLGRRQNPPAGSHPGLT